MILLLNPSWFVLIRCSSDFPRLTYTVRPWVTSGLFLHGLPSPVLVDTPKKESSLTIRLVDSQTRPESDSPETSRPSTAPSIPGIPTPSPCSPVESIHTSRPSSKQDGGTPEQRTPRSVLFGPRDKNQSSPHTPTPTARARGKTFPLLGSSPRTPENGRSDSALSWTPSSSSKHLTTWFSGLLGR